MARYQRHDVDYFPHPCKHGKKMFYIERKYGNDGYATWHKILEELGSADYHYLDMQSEVPMFLAAKCNVSEVVLMAIIEDLVKMDVFDKALWKDGILFNQTFVDRIQDVYLKRKNLPPTKDSIRELLQAKGRLKPINPGRKPLKPELQGVENTGSKVKESKVKQVYRAFAHLSLSIEEFEKLIEDGYTKQQIDLVCDDVENYSKNKQYKSLNLTIRKWMKRDGIIPGQKNIHTVESQQTAQAYKHSAAH